MLLIRHGQTPSNVLGILDTAAPGAALSALGQRQAQAVPAALEGERVAGIYVSGLVRTHLTAEPLAAATGLVPRVHEGLNEIAAGALETRSDPEAVHAYVGCAERWARGDLDVTLPGGESGHEFRHRYEQALRAVALNHPDDATVVVVSHGAAIRVYAAMAVAHDRAAVEDRSLNNTGMVTLAGHLDRGFAVLDWVEHPIGGAHLVGDTEHDVTADPDAVPEGVHA
ncbi:histidine phosphatase family protein [Pseudactinotalea suaedae]